MDAWAVEEAITQMLLANGLRVGVEDFGAGRWGLSAVEHLPLHVVPLHVVRIDRSFATSIGDASDPVICAMVDAAHARAVRVIAERIESPRQARRLREHGCDFAQGFHFGRPGEAARIVRG